jgi:hypothetical protein
VSISAMPMPWPVSVPAAVPPALMIARTSARLVVAVAAGAAVRAGAGRRAHQPGDQRRQSEAFDAQWLITGNQRVTDG